VLGSYTEADATAMKSALGSYSDQVMSDPNSATPMSWADYLDTAAANGKLTGGPQRAPLQLTDPATLQHTLQSAAQNALGRNLSKAELNHFVHAFHGQEQDAYDTSGKGQTYTNPDVAGEAMSFVDSGHTAEEHQFQEAGYVDVINKMFGVL
jgi:hypothetical protein